MSEINQGPPKIQLDEQGDVLTGPLADVIEWFFMYDQRVAVIRHPQVEQVFQWKQNDSASEGDEVYHFNRAEDRLAIGIIQALAENSTEEKLHGWISQLLNVLDESAKTNEEIAEAFKLDKSGEASAVDEAAKLPSERERRVYLTCCWLEVLCTAEIRVLGWVYQELYGKPYSPQG